MLLHGIAYNLHRFTFTLKRIVLGFHLDGCKLLTPFTIIKKRL